MKTDSSVEHFDLETLSSETGVPVEMLRTLAGISDPANEHRFTARAALAATPQPVGTDPKNIDYDTDYPKP